MSRGGKKGENKGYLQVINGCSYLLITLIPISFGYSAGLYIYICVCVCVCVFILDSAVFLAKFKKDAFILRWRVKSDHIPSNIYIYICIKFEKKNTFNKNSE